MVLLDPEKIQSRKYGLQKIMKGLHKIMSACEYIEVPKKHTNSKKEDL